MDFVKLGIQRLNSNNYDIWKYRVEQFLIREDLWYVIKDELPAVRTEKQIKDDARARATIGLLLEDSQLPIIRAAETAKSAWDEIKAYYVKETPRSIVSLIKRLSRTVLTDDGSVEEHLMAMESIFERFNDTDSKVPDTIKVGFLLASLPESYDNFVSSMEARDASRMTVLYVKEMLLNEGVRRKERQIGTASENKALRTFDTSKTKKKTCFYCGKPGHYKRDCRKLRFDQGQSSSNQHHHENAKISLTDVKEEYTCLTTADFRSKDVWCMDSGATKHMTWNRSIFTEFRPMTNTVTMADGDKIECHGIGSVKLYSMDLASNKTNILLQEVLFVPELSGNLISVGRLTDKGCLVSFDNKMCCVSLGQKTLITAKKDGCLYLVKTPETCFKVCADVHNDLCVHQWHRRLGHRDIETVKRLGRSGQIKIVECGSVDRCEVCIKGKLSRKPFPKKDDISTTEILELVHADVCGPLDVITPSGNRYILTITDDFSRYCHVMLLKQKSDVAQQIKDFVARMETSLERLPKIIRMYNGGEFVNREVKMFCRSKGITSQFTVPHNPEQNGVSERRNRYMMDMTRCLLFDANLPTKYWGEAVTTAIFIQNRTPNSKIKYEIPYERWTGKSVDFNDMKIFGCQVYAHIPKVKRRKLDPKAEKLVFVGYSESSKGYRLLNVSNDKITLSRDIVVVKSVEQQPCVEIELAIPPQTENTTVELIPREITPESPRSPVVDINLIDFGRTPTPENIVRRSARANIGVPPIRFSPDMANVVLQDGLEPVTYQEAMNCEFSEEWQQAMDDEYESLMKNGTWDLMPLPPGRKAVDCKWVYKLKEGLHGEKNRFKARLVARGFSQVYGEDYDQVFAPVVRQTTLRLLMTIAGSKNYRVKHYDIKTAFLYGDLQETIFMKQPQGFKRHGQENLVCCLKKSLYGLKQSARAWNQRLDGVLCKLGFKAAKSDPCLYTKTINNKLMYISIYVDDIIIAFDDEDEIRQIGRQLSEQFEITDLGDARHFLGIEIERNMDGTYSICQRNYIKKVLDRFGLSWAKGSSFPMDPGYAKAEKGENLPDNHEYRQIIGSLLYLSINSRPDISAATSILSRKVSCPNTLDMNEAKRTLKYLRTTIDYKLKLGDCSLSGLVGYADSDWAGDKTDSKSMSGIIFKYNGASISWMSRKQPCVSLSSTEAEYIALSEAIKEFSWLKSLLDDFGENLDFPITIFEDNQGCIKLANSEGMGRNTKHINTRYNFVKEYVAAEEVKLQYCPTENMLADLLTKPLHGTKMGIFSSKIGLHRSFSIEEECWDYGSTGK